MKRLRDTIDNNTDRRRIWLAAVNGRRLPVPHDVAPIDEPEHPLEVEFVGLTPEQQRRALAFPGGRRFVLKDAAAD